MAAACRPDPVDLASSLVLADYTWLPACRHDTFQAVLERDEGIARVYFVAEIDLVLAVTEEEGDGGNDVEITSIEVEDEKERFGLVNSHRINSSRSPASSHREKSQSPLMTTRAVALMTCEALYVCDVAANVLRHLPLPHVESVGVIQGVWVWLRASLLTFGDVVFRLVQENESPLAIQRVFLRVFSAAVKHTTLASSAALMMQTTTGSDCVQLHSNFSRVRLSSLTHQLCVSHITDIPLLPYEKIWREVSNPHALIDHMHLRHQLSCGRPPSIAYKALNDPTIGWSNSEAVEARDEEEELHEGLVNPSPRSLYYSYPSSTSVTSSVRRSQSNPLGVNMAKGREKRKGRDETTANDSAATSRRPSRPVLEDEEDSRVESCCYSPRCVEEQELPVSFTLNFPQFSTSDRKLSSAERVINPTRLHENFFPSQLSSNLFASPMHGVVYCVESNEGYERRRKRRNISSGLLHDTSVSPEGEMWEASIERLMQHSNSPHCGSYERNYAREITQDIVLSHMKSPPVLSLITGECESCESEVKGGPTRLVTGHVTAEWYLEPTEAFVVCPPLRM